MRPKPPLSHYLAPYDVLITLFCSGLFFLPLDPFGIEKLLPASQKWNDLLTLWLLVLLILSLYTIIFHKKQWDTLCVRYTILLSLLAFIPSVFAIYTPPSLPSLLRILALLWTAPILFSFLSRRSIQFASYAFLGVLCLQSQWAILQFSTQVPLGFYILGESHAISDMPGIAKFAIGSYKAVRAYGPYQHSNILAGSMLSGLILAVGLLIHRRLTHKELLYLTLTGYSIFLAILLSFSRAAYVSLFLLGLLPVLALILYKEVRKRAVFFVPYLLTILVFIPLLFFRGTDSQDMAITDRARSYEWWHSIITSHSVLQGSGIGRYTDDVHRFLLMNNVSYQPWEVDFVHSVPLLLIAEWGLTISVLFIAALSYIFYRLKKRARLVVVALVFITAPLLLTDHYFLTATTPGVLLVTVWVILYLLLESPEKTSR